MSEISRFIYDTKLGIIQLLSGENEYYTYSNFDLNSVSIKLKNQIEKFFEKKAFYKNESWINIDFEHSTLSLNNIQNDYDLSINEIPKYIINLLNESDKNFNFEICCSIFFEKILSSLTVEHRAKSRDGGIDFYGNFTSQSCLLDDKIMTNFLDVNSWYIGQAKYYKFENGISTSYLRELIGTVELAKRNIWATKKGHNHFASIQHYHHIVPIFLTNSYFTRDSYNIAEEFNIKLFDTIDIVFWISVLFDCNKNEFKKKFLYEKTRKY